MKLMKKVLSLAVCFMMVMSLVTVTKAASHTITVPEGHAWEIYQIFTGEYSNGKLSNVQWGQNAATGKSGAVEATDIEALTAINSASDHAKLAKIKEFVNLSSAPYATIAKGETTATVETGYYLVKDVNVTGDDAYSLYIVQVVGENITIQPKTGKPTVEKKVKDINDTTGEETGWVDTADHDIGDEVSFQLKANLTGLDKYEAYYVNFHDTLSDGLTLNPGTIEVKVGTTVLPIEAYKVTVTGQSFTVEVFDVKAYTTADTATVTVEYTATLNENAVIGSAGNPNEVYLTYSNNPNSDYDGYGPNPGDKPTPPTSGEEPTYPTKPEEEGETPKDKVIVFTYKLVVNKVNENNEALAGAGFTLYKKLSDGTYVQIGNEVTGTDLTTFTWTGIDDGEYKLVETTTPAGYNTMADLTFTVTATHDDETLSLTSLSGDTFTGEVTTGTLTSDIVNKEGSTLPSTGGMGTTILYVGGAALMVGAAILLVSKKRMQA